MNCPHKSTIQKARNADRPKMVLLWGREDVLAKSFELFLSNKKEWEVIRYSDKHDDKFIFKKVREMNPDVFIIYQGNLANPTSLPGRVLQEFPNLKVIIVSLESNFMEIYCKQKILVREVSDLIAVVEA